ncbi:hypothetical protein MJO28_002234 [Puccinia striiformis f. sp. tritici]|uniref:High-affinity iron permease n=2 Tax=Puccinia striiformis f. sp. tritici TaxID=168172 RepID=A0A0L0USU7_9BASI|nr:hypothetical protein Pst134EA_002544 [Puccinia striiformis f. sp. tritici]KAI9609975.1 hypothetical protein H4Q26_006967 [Puccinia striiformis f. sp. tritici PST-130]KNE89976.1 hypothetical protein PSTG_16560 [Puccinia striiformis f. sp. tritici PST-78]KAH9464133.1 hypothetical protein Pst134EB_003668 [Puccinia striiformis f. sp. tritici]KAH9471913.1 hypothetical protein Pst134EA_002544 [Puccinia striiformis f. sp. tritici]KAI7961745.1 hypothetical protein MJO28_002234 [Puccinia striiformis
MTANLFSVPIFLICFREVLEAAIILSVLLALIEQIVKPLDQNSPTGTRDQLSIETPRLPRLEENLNQSHLELESLASGHAAYQHPIGKDNEAYRDKIIKRMRLQVFSGTFAGLFCSMCIGAGFLAVYYTKLTDIYGNAEELWEGIFSLIASGMIFVMGITMMRIDRSKIKWRIKLSKAFEQENIIDGDGDGPQTFSKFRRVVSMLSVGGKRTDSGDSTSSRYILFFLPALTVLREGLEAVVFIGGVSLGQPAASIPIAAVTGIMLGLVIGYAIYNSSARLNLSLFLTISTIALMYVGAGLITKAAWYFKMYSYIRMVGGDAAEAGDGPGSFPVDGYIWHLDYGNPENKLAAGGWMIFAGVFGWNNTGSILTVMIYISFWLIASATLIFMKWHEGRCTIFNVSSSARKQRLARLNGTGEGNQHDYDRD